MMNTEEHVSGSICAFVCVVLQCIGVRCMAIQNDNVLTVILIYLVVIVDPLSSRAWLVSSLFTYYCQYFV